MIDIEDIKRLDLRPFDTLVVKCTSVISDAKRADVEKAFAKLLPDFVGRIVVIDPSIELVILGKPEQVVSHV